MERLFEVFECFSKVAHSNLKFSQVSVDLRRHYVRGAEDFEAAIYAGLKEEVRVLHIALADVQVGHNVVNSDLHRMVITPVIVQNGEGLAKVDVRVLSVPIHEMSLDQDAVKLNGLGMQWAKCSI